MLNGGTTNDLRFDSSVKFLADNAIKDGSGNSIFQFYTSSYDGVSAPITRFGATMVLEGANAPSFLSRDNIVLRIDSNNDSTSNYFSVEADAGTELFRIKETGNVGIGNTAPAAKLDLTTSLSSGATLDLFKSALTSYPSNTNVKGAYIEFTDDSNAGGCAVFGIDVDITHAKNHASNRIYGVHSVLDGTGSNNQYAGYFESAAALNYLGDHGQSATLLVNGKGTGHLFRVEDNDTGVFTILDGGNVGINTLTPSFDLDIHGDARIIDNKILRFGDGGDLQLHHNASDSKIHNFTGDLTIANFADAKDIIFQSDDGSGSLATYLTLDGSQADGTNTYTVFPDNSRIALGNSNDFQLFHNASNTRLVQNTGELSIEQQATDQIITLQADNGSGGITPYLTIDGGQERVTVSKNLHTGNLYPTGQVSIDGDIFLQDGHAINLGNSSDAFLKHTGTTGRLNNSTGDLYVSNTAADRDVIFQANNGSGGTATYMTVDGSTETVAFSKAITQGTTLVNDANHTTTRNDTVILLHSMSTYRNLTIASADCIAGRMIHVKNRDNNQYVYIYTEGSETIDGASSDRIDTTRGAMTLVSDGSNWSIISKYTT